MADGLTVGAMTCKPTFVSIGVRVLYTGDDNEDSTIVLQYKVTGNGGWLTAHTMYKDTTNREFLGSIIGLSENTSYDIQATFTDTDGVTGTNPVTDTITTMNSNPTIGASEIFVATDGNDDTGDGSIETPYLTPDKALSVVADGETILLRGGTYSIDSPIDIYTSGTDGNWITIMPYNGETVTIDGQDSTDYFAYAIEKHYYRWKDLNFCDFPLSGFHWTVSHDVIIEGCTFDNVHQEYGYLKDDGTSSLYGAITFKGKQSGNENFICYNCLVQDCTFSWDNAAVATTSGVGLVWAQYGITVRDCIATCTEDFDYAELYDFVSTYPEDAEGADELLESCDIYNNVVYNSRDDGLQMEGGCCNARIWGNYIEHCRIGLANCPVLVGPCYVYRNVVWDTSEILDRKLTKVGKQTTGYGRLYYYHNTLISNGSVANNGITQTNDDVGNIVSRNNILYGGRYVLELKNSINVPCDFDYDYLWSTDVPDNNYFVKYGADGANTLAILQDKTGQEVNGVSVADPRFANAGAGDFQLREDSPCINAGVAIQGFNDADSEWPAYGGTPDIGAYEFTGGETIPYNDIGVSATQLFGTTATTVRVIETI